MKRVALKVAAADYDYLAPLASGDVVMDGVDLTLIRSVTDALTITLDDTTVDAGELSFSRHIIRLVDGDRSFVGIPFFVRAFRHRCFFVKRNSKLHDLKDLAGKRVGTDEWPATGNTWSRAALRELGVPLSGIQWYVGTLEGQPVERPQGTLPSYAQRAPSGKTLKEMLLEDNLDALMCPGGPSDLYAANSQIVRLPKDFQRVESEYFQRTGIFPATHLMGIRRTTFEREPWVAQSLYLALEQCKTLWQSKLQKMSEMTPWLLIDVEKTRMSFGKDWNPGGTAANIKMLQMLCDEMLAQELITSPVDAKSIFAEFDGAVRATPRST